MARARADHDQQGCTDVFAVSVAGATPSALLSWFQAVEACKNSQKRLPSNLEWQMAVTDTPDAGADNGTTDCNTGSVGSPVSRGSRSACRSSVGAHDMVGNVHEWVADWVPVPEGCTTWGGLSDDFMCLAGVLPSVTSPAAIARGGGSFAGPLAGPLSVAPLPVFTAFFADVGFRCVR